MTAHQNHTEFHSVSSKDIEDVKEKDLGYTVNTESGVVHRPAVWAEDVVPKRWRTVCGGAFGFSHFEVSCCDLWKVFKTKEQRSSSQKSAEQLFEFFRAV